MMHYDFSIYNIQKIMAQMRGELVTGIQETILALFDKLSCDHAWYPETKNNILYYDGWKTNQAHKVNRKVIIPCPRIIIDSHWSDPFEVYIAEAVLSDIEKVLNYLDGNRTGHVDLQSVLKQACKEGKTRKISCKFFDVSFYKKGTVHIKFRDMDLLDRFNIYVAQKRNWLPPSYGRKPYTNMTVEERKVVDFLQGEKAYNVIVANTDYFLSDPVSSVLVNDLLAIGSAKECQDQRQENTFSVSNKAILDWFVTDDDCFQCCRVIDKQRHVYELIQTNALPGYAACYQVAQGTIALEDYDKETIRSYMRSYGYESIEEFEHVHGGEIIWYQIAEMVFEMEAYKMACSKNLTFEEAKAEVERRTGLTLS